MSVRNLNIDFSKLLLSFMVVGIHVDLFNDIGREINFLLVDGIFRLAVPFFFIINGYFYHSVKPGASFFWFKRILGLYFFWSVFFAFFWVDFNKPLLTTLYVLFGYYHLWYVVGVLLSGMILSFVSTLLVAFCSTILLIMMLNIYYSLMVKM